METNFLSSTAGESPPLPNNEQFRKAIGSLLYLATVSRPDIAFAVNLLCRRVESPTHRDWTAVKRVMRYLAGSVHRKLCFATEGSTVLTGFVDADWAGDHADRKSTSGHVFQIGHSSIVWSSKKQSVVAMSSTEAEYIAAWEACRELQWLRQLLRDMSLPQDGPTNVYEDNQSCIKVAQLDRCSQRTKHIDVRHHQLRDLQESGVVALIYRSSNDMPADILTKPLAKDKFNHHLALLGMR
uniref:Reverse transcriptase Ty1/copia-type domain-containing protein n=1 Tax=Trichuris muris TaxID=70415 RepID=A0A5S6QNT0_TRIMR